MYATFTGCANVLVPVTSEFPCSTRSVPLKVLQLAVATLVLLNMKPTQQDMQQNLDVQFVKLVKVILIGYSRDKEYGI